MSKLNVSVNRGTKLVYRDDVYKEYINRKGQKKWKLKENVVLIGKIELGAPVCVLEKNGKRNVYKDDINKMKNNLKADLVNKILYRNNIKEESRKPKLVYLIKEKD